MSALVVYEIALFVMAMSGLVWFVWSLPPLPGERDE